MKAPQATRSESSIQGIRYAGRPSRKACRIPIAVVLALAFFLFTLLIPLVTYLTKDAVLRRMGRELERGLLGH